jgi:outer membrane protein OmpA-like peptidoglycan-associated protein
MTRLPALLILLLFLQVFSLYGQGPTEDLEMATADANFARKCYASAIPFYLQKIKAGSADAITFYKAGVCYLNSRSQKKKAAEYLEKAIYLSTSFATQGIAKETDAPADVFQQLGDAYRHQLRFTEALANYQKYQARLKESKVKDAAALQTIASKIENARFEEDLKQVIGLPPNFKMASIITNEKDPVGEFSSAYTPDKSAIVYTLKIPVSNVRKYDDVLYFEETNTGSADSSENLKAPAVHTNTATLETLAVKPGKKKAPDLNQDTIVNITTVGTSVDGQVMLTYKNENGEGNLYVQRLNANQWSYPVKLPKAANIKGWEPGEFISADGNALYFASDRAGGYGGKDIYRCKRMANGEWSKATNLGPEINTAFDDEAPFLHSDGVTLYYSSNRNKPTVMYDIFTSQISGDSWGKPLIVGYPVNSSEDNSFYQVKVDKKKLLAANTSSNTKESATANKTEVPVAKLGKEEKIKRLNDSLAHSEQPAGDNYLITFENQTKGNLTLLKGEVVGTKLKAEVPLVTDIYVINNSTEKTIGIFQSDKTGKFSLVLPGDINCGVRYEAPGYLFRSENHHLNNTKNYFSKHKPVQLQPMSEAAETRLSNVFFEEDNAKILHTSIPELEFIYDLLAANPGMKIKLHNYIYSKDNSLKTISQWRAEAVMDYLVQKGIDKKRIKAKGYHTGKLPKGEEVDPVILKSEKPVQWLEMEITELKQL